MCGIVDKANQRARTISVAMATFNGQEHLCEQLCSLSGQTSLPSELVITDDGSTDRTLEILRAFKEMAPFDVKLYVNKERLGYTGNFMKACSLTSGDLIALCDQDDVWVKEKLEHLKGHFEEESSEITLVAHSIAAYDEKMHPLGWNVITCTSEGIMDRWGKPVLPPFDIWGSSMIFRRSEYSCLWDAWLTYCESRGQNYGLTVNHDTLIAAVGHSLGSVCYCPAAFVQHRFHGKNSSWRPQLGPSGVGMQARRFLDSWVIQKDEYASKVSALSRDLQMLYWMCNSLPQEKTRYLISIIEKHEAELHRTSKRCKLYSGDSQIDRIRQLSIALSSHVYVDSGRIRWARICKDAIYCLLPHWALRLTVRLAKKRIRPA